MKAAEFNGWLLETAAPWAAGHDSQSCNYRAWVSNPARIICGFGVSRTSTRDAICMALEDALHHWAKDCDAIAGLEEAYFGPHGMLAKGGAA